MSEPIHVRVFASGDVERDTLVKIGGHTFGCPLRNSDKWIRISPFAARAFVAQTRDAGFCRLCRSYGHTGSVSDGSIEEITLSVRGKAKTVRNRGGHPPPVFSRVSDQIVILSDLNNLANPGEFSLERIAECQRFENGLRQP